MSPISERGDASPATESTLTASGTPEDPGQTGGASLRCRDHEGAACARCRGTGVEPCSGCGAPTSVVVEADGETYCPICRTPEAA